MNKQTEILNAGKRIYLSPQNRYTGPNNREYTDEPGYSAAKYILAEERFITNHDDTAMFIELIDEDEKVMKSWKFDHPVKNSKGEDIWKSPIMILILSSRRFFWKHADWSKPTISTPDTAASGTCVSWRNLSID